MLDLVATTGGDGDNKILLWNVRNGEIVSDLNASYRLVPDVSYLTSIDFLH